MDGDTKPCPVCGETIKAVALKCRFCNTDLSSFLQTKEAEVEKDLFVGHPAVIYSVSQITPMVVLLAIAIAAIVWANAPAGITIAAYIVLDALVCLNYLIKSRSVRYHITNQRIKYERGFLSKVQEMLELFRVDHFELRKPLGMRLLGQCSLHMFSSDAELENFYLYGIPGLEALADTLRDCQLRERTRRGLTTFVKA